MIRFASVTKEFGESGPSRVFAVRDLSLHVPEGQFCAVMGPSGSGKSTLLHLVAGLTEPTAGEIELEGRPLSGMNEDEKADLRCRKLGFIFQFFHLMPYLTIQENVSLPLLIDGVSSAEIERRTEEVLARVKLDRLERKATHLSGGEMQRVAIARALINHPQVILADEPTGNLDSVASHGIMRLLTGTAEDLKVTVLLVTHDPISASYADRIVRLVDGEIKDDIDLTTATAKELLADPLEMIRSRLQ